MEIDNPSAFPRGYAPGGHNGMTLRDWFAGQAAPLIWSSALDALTKEYKTDQLAAEVVAKAAYVIADAMLAERAK